MIEDTQTTTTWERSTLKATDLDVLFQNYLIGRSSSLRWSSVVNTCKFLESKRYITRTLARGHRESLDSRNVACIHFLAVKFPYAPCIWREWHNGSTHLYPNLLVISWQIIRLSSSSKHSAEQTIIAQISMKGESLAVQPSLSGQITIGNRPKGKAIGHSVNHQSPHWLTTQHAKYLAPSQLYRCQHEHHLYAVGQKRTWFIEAVC